MSYSASTIGLPQLRASSSARYAAFCRIFSASRNSTVHVVGVGIWDLRDDFLSCRIINRKRLARLAFSPLAVDVHPVRTNFCFYSCWHRDLLHLPGFIQPDSRRWPSYVVLLICTGETPAPTSRVVDFRRP